MLFDGGRVVIRFRRIAPLKQFLIVAVFAHQMRFVLRGIYM
jgi:hypothetical protein